MPDDLEARVRRAYEMMQEQSRHYARITIENSRQDKRIQKQRWIITRLLAMRPFRAADVSERIALMVSYAHDFTPDQKWQVAMALLEGTGLMVVPKDSTFHADTGWAVAHAGERGAGGEMP